MTTNQCRVELKQAIPHWIEHNEWFNADSRNKPFIDLNVEVNGQEADFRLPLVRNSETHEITAINPIGDKCEGHNNRAVFEALGISLSDSLVAYEALTRLADSALKYERTEEDRISEGLQAHLTDLHFMHEMDMAGDDYDGVDYDPDDDFHKWLIDNEFAGVETDDDDPDDKTLSLISDWQDRLNEYFDNYFLSVRVANTPEGNAPCVEADICIGGPTCYLKQFFGRGYVLVYSWGGISEDYALDAEMDDWLDDRFGVNC